jgi:hypothetical protein
MAGDLIGRPPVRVALKTREGEPRMPYSPRCGRRITDDFRAPQARRSGCIIHQTKRSSMPTRDRAPVGSPCWADPYVRLATVTDPAGAQFKLRTPNP